MNNKLKNLIRYKKWIIKHYDNELQNKICLIHNKQTKI